MEKTGSKYALSLGGYLPSSSACVQSEMQSFLAGQAHVSFTFWRTVSSDGGGQGQSKVHAWAKAHSSLEPPVAVGERRGKAARCYLGGDWHASRNMAALGATWWDALCPLGNASSVLWACLATQGMAAGDSSIPWMVAESGQRMSHWCCLPVLTPALAAMQLISTICVHCPKTVLQARLGCLPSDSLWELRARDMWQSPSIGCYMPFQCTPNKYCSPVYILTVNISRRLQTIARSVGSQSSLLLKVISFFHTSPFTAPHPAAMQSIVCVCHKALPSEVNLSENANCIFGGRQIKYLLTLFILRYFYGTLSVRK